MFKDKELYKELYELEKRVHALENNQKISIYMPYYLAPYPEVLINVVVLKILAELEKKTRSE